MIDALHDLRQFVHAADAGTRGRPLNMLALDANYTLNTPWCTVAVYAGTDSHQFFLCPLASEGSGAIIATAVHSENETLSAPACCHIKDDKGNRQAMLDALGRILRYIMQAKETPYEVWHALRDSRETLRSVLTY